MKSSPIDELTYYSDHGAITDPGAFSGLFDAIPADVSELCGIVQGLLLHVFWAERYGEKLSEERESEPGLRHVQKMLCRLLEINDSPLTEPRRLQNRLIGNCRNFSVLLTSMLQAQGIPARARCGFGRYFLPNWYEDHWVCEYWNEEQKRWILVDAQLDEFQQNELEIAFDPVDVPRNQFIVGGKAWHTCRSGKADPENFGIFDMRGLWFIRGDFVRDIAALNKVELLPWDSWGLADSHDQDLSQEDLNLLDEIAFKTFDEVDYTYIREVYEAQDGLLVPSIIKSYSQSGPLSIELATEQLVEQQAIDS